jgi:hypothetical protein
MPAVDPHTLDAEDPLKWARDEFEIPLKSDSGGDGMSNLFHSGDATDLVLLTRQWRGRLPLWKLIGSFAEASSQAAQ